MNQVIPFTYEGTSVRTVTTEDGEPWFVLSDVCSILKLTNPSEVAKRLDEDEINTLRISEGIGNPNKNIISEAGLYAVILRSNSPSAKPFRRWVTHEVLPAIRRHGMYATPDTIEKMLADPDTMITVLEALKAERAKRAELESENAAQKQALAEVQPKVSYYDLVITSHDAVPVTNIAKQYGMSARKLNAKLHELGVQYRVGGKRNWVLTAKYQGHGYTDTKTHVIDQGNHTVIHTYWTQKGRLFLYDLLKQHGILPEIERGEAA